MGILPHQIRFRLIRTPMNMTNAINMPKIMIKEFSRGFAGEGAMGGVIVGLGVFVDGTLGSLLVACGDGESVGVGVAVNVGVGVFV